MTTTLRSEFRKLFSVRSTYIIFALALALTVLFAFYFEGYRGNTNSPAAELAPTALREIITNGIGMSIMFASIIGILFIGHEYRYNTIMYTLTASGRRTKVFFAKLFAISSFTIAFGIILVSVALASYMIGLSLRDATLPAQTNFNIFMEMGKVIFYCLGYALVASIIAFLSRSIVIGIAALFIIPTTIEPLLSIVLKENSKYLPFSSLDSVMGASLQFSVLSPGNAIIVSSIYLAIGVAISWFFFVRRDAN